MAQAEELVSTAALGPEASLALQKLLLCPGHQPCADDQGQHLAQHADQLDAAVVVTQRGVAALEQRHQHGLPGHLWHAALPGKLH